MLDEAGENKASRSGCNQVTVLPCHQSSPSQPDCIASFVFLLSPCAHKTCAQTLCTCRQGVLKKDLKTKQTFNLDLVCNAAQSLQLITIEFWFLWTVRVTELFHAVVQLSNGLIWIFFQIQLMLQHDVKVLLFQSDIRFNVQMFDLAQLSKQIDWIITMLGNLVGRLIPFSNRHVSPNFALRISREK